MSDSQIFKTAVKLPPEERQAYLDEACGNNESLRREVEALLRASDAHDSFLEKPAADLNVSSPTLNWQPIAETAGSKIGPYKLLQQIGEGGMGVVYLAEQQEPMRRKVALKIIQPGMDSRQVVARFEAERQALAMMEHQNIARVLDAGTTETGRPYFVMELVKGVPITDFCDKNQLSPRERLDLFVPVCHAVQHAHQKGIIHRDLKPSNVLVCLYDGQPTPKVIDFGVAKATEQRMTEKTMFTQHGQIVGTLEYMSPEQAEMNQLDVDTRSDIYSLGVLLYELLTGSTPITKEQLRNAGLAEMLRLIREQEPVRPSTRLSESGDALPTISAQRRTELKKLSLLLRGELDWIVMKALEKNRTRRYESASAFGADVERYLNDEAVEACPPSATYRLRKLADRHRVALVTTAAFVVLLIVGVCVSTWQAIRARQAEVVAQTRLTEGIEARAEAEASRIAAVEARRREEQQRREAETARDVARQAATASEDARKKAVTAREAEERQRRQADASLEASQRNLYFNKILLAQRYWDVDNLERAERILDECPPRFRHWEWRYLKQLCHAEQFSFPGNLASFSPNGKQLAIVQPVTPGVERVLLWDVDSQQEVATIEPGAGGIYALAFTNDGTQLAFACEDEPSPLPTDPAGSLRHVPHSVRLIALASNDEILRMATGTDLPLDLAISPDNKHISLATGVSNPVQGGLMPGRLIVWNTESGEVAWEKEHFGQTVAFHPQGSWLATVHGIRSPIPFPGRGTGLTGCDLSILGVTDGRQATHQVSKPEMIYSIAYSPDGTLVAASLSDGVYIISAEDAKILYVLEQPTRGDTRGSVLAFSADSARLATGDTSGAVRIWDVSSRTIIRTYRAHAGSVIDVSFHPSGDYLASSGTDGTVRVWDSRQQQQWKLLPRKLAFATAINLQKRQYATLSSYGPLLSSRMYAIELRQIETGAIIKTLAEFQLTSGIIDNALTLSADGTRLAGEVGDNVISVWDTETSEPVATLSGHTERVRAIALDPQAKLLASCTSKEVRLWDLESGRQICHIPTTGEGREPLFVGSIAFSRDSQRLAVVGAGASTQVHFQPGRVELWEAGTGQLLRTWPLAHELPVADVAFSHDGQLLATAGWDEVVGIWDLKTGEQLHKLHGHRSYVLGVTFSPDDERIVSTDSSMAKLWDAKTGQEILSFDLPKQLGGSKPSFDPIGRSLAVAGSDGGIILDAQEPLQNRPPMEERVGE